jgi:hypothetical protein
MLVLLPPPGLDQTCYVIPSKGVFDGNRVSSISGPGQSSDPHFYASFDHQKGLGSTVTTYFLSRRYHSSPQIRNGRVVFVLEAPALQYKQCCGDFLP